MGGTQSTYSNKTPNASNNNSSGPAAPTENTNTNAFAAVALAPPPPQIATLKRSASQEFLDDTIAENPVVVFSKTTCPACVNAKNVFDTLGVNYKTVELDRRTDCSQLQDDLLRMTGARTVPRVFVGGQCIGGGSDTVSMFKQGSLQKLLQRKNIECPRCDDEAAYLE